MDTRAYRPPISRTFTYKKVTKPLLERRRRARISRCLEELKSFITGPDKAGEDGSNRLEKADILELTVGHLQKMMAFSSRNRFQEGFDECAAEACHFLEKSSDFEGSLSERLVEHLETFTGPLSIQVPQYKLSFSQREYEGERSCFHTPISYDSLPSTGLLMKSKPAENPSKIDYHDSGSPTNSNQYSKTKFKVTNHYSENDHHASRSMWQPWKH